MKANRINFEISASTLKEVMDAIELASAKLKPVLLTDITKSDLDGYARMGDSSYSFVASAIDCANTKPSLVPGYHNLEEAKSDQRYYEAMREIGSKLENLTGLVAMNRELAGVELLDFSNDIYASVKRSYQVGDPDGIVMYQTLKPRYARPKRKGKDEA